MNPFLKWAGGKRWLTKSLRDVIGPIEGRYIEPFLGGAAVFFSLSPKNALLSDCNKELVDTYKAIQTQHAAVERHLQEHQLLHSKEYYYEIRRNIPQGLAKKAARFIYLNRTCWNGLYRVNLSGQFNVPIGTKTTVLLDSDDFKKTSEILKSASIVTSDFENSIAAAREGDVVFCDPPYTVRHKNNGFVKYNEDLFVWNDQIRLRDCLRDAKSRGARVFVTNADHSSLRELYSSDFRLIEYERFSPIGGAKAVRGKYSELLICG
jgi:DNA adenine methylase